MAWHFPKRKKANSGEASGHSCYLPKKKAWILVAAFLLVASVLLNLGLIKRHKVDHKVIVAQRKALNKAAEPDDASSTVAGAVSSVVPGNWLGLCPRDVIRSIEDFRKLVAGDPLLAMHFADFDWKNARMGNLEEAIWTHVAYRKDGKIRTTRKVIRLPKGDGYITDGKRWVRTYCCNDYVLAGSSEQSVENIATDEEQFRQRGSTDEDTIPEPNTFALVATGVAGLGLLRFRIRRK